VENGTAIVEHMNGDLELVLPRTQEPAATAVAEGVTGV